MNKLSQFWQELKRRNVVRRNTVYAATAFVILELVSIVGDPLNLPDWTLLLVIILLSIGFIISLITSWIYEINSEGDIEKTKPANKIKDEEKPASLNNWKIASYISFVVIIALIVLNIIPHTKRSGINEILDKSIAVLPFRNDSSDEENEYFINGTMEAILDHLSKIEDLRVVSRTSVEQYRGTSRPTIPEIAKAMNVNYVLEGSGQKNGDNIHLTIQLVDAVNDKNIWSSPYTREIEIDEIFTLQREIAQLVAAEIKAIITPEEKQLIEKIPTGSLTAYDLYQRGKDEHLKYQLDNSRREALERAEDLYHNALEYDATYAQAYTGLAQVYWEKHYWETFLSENFLDSMLILADIALSFDDQLAEAYVIRGDYYRFNYKKEQAINEYDKAIKLNPNYWEAYYQKGWLYINDDFVKSISNHHKAAILHRGFFLPELYRNTAFLFSFIGFDEKSRYYEKEALKLDDDSAKYYRNLAGIEETNSNFEQAIDFGKKANTIDSTNWKGLFRLGFSHSYLGQFEEYLIYLKKYKKIIETSKIPDPWGMFRVGHAYWVNGYIEEAEYYIKKGLEFHNEMIELDRHPHQDYYTFYNLAAIYAFLGERDKAYEYLRLVNQKPRMPKWMIKDLNYDPLFESIRDEAEFQQIVRDVEAKYQAEHERVRQWLEENDL